MANTVTMTYGSYTFSPVPLITLSREIQRTDDGTPVGTIFNLTLDGTLDATNQGTSNGGIIAMELLQEQLRSGLAEDGQLFEVRCNGNLVMACHPRIVGELAFNQSSNNWVHTAPFSVTLEFDDEPTGSGENGGLMPPYISSATETWSLEFAEETSKYSLSLGVGPDTNPTQLRLTHTVSAVGKRHFDTGGLVKPAWEQARDYVLPRLGYNSDYVHGSGAINIATSGFTPYNHIRRNSVNELGGGYEVTESWVVIDPSGAGIAGNAIEDFTVTIRENQSTTDLTTITVEGSIQGLETVNYGSNPGDYTVTETKFAAASGYYEAIKDNLRIYPRAVAIAGSTPSRTINNIPISKVVAYNPPKGIINYTYEFDDRPSNCISGAKSEVFEIIDNFPTDLFASLVVLGRSQGPVLQDLSTQTAATRGINIEIVMEPPTGCPTTEAGAAAIIAASPKSEVDVIIQSFEDDLTTNYEQVFLTQDQQSWDIKTGRYTRNVQWTYQACN